MNASGEYVVVVADDDPLTLALVTRRLKHRGFVVHAVTDGDAALQAIRDHLPDVAVIDWVMPGRWGDEVLRDLRADDTIASIPVVLLTARAADDVLAGFDAGADDYLTKPFDMDELERTLRRLAGGR